MTQARLANGVSLACEVHGDPANPVLFVILGISDNITDWPPGFYEPLVEAGYCVARHELRDSGQRHVPTDPVAICHRALF